MHFSIAANWDHHLLDKLGGRSVTSLYGQRWGDPIGGGRMLLFLPRIGREEASRFIKKARSKGIGFNYLINATCLDNREFTRGGYRNITEHLEWISMTGADMVTVSLPFLLEIVKNDFPNLKVCVSSFVRVQNVQMARFWEDLGADRIVLPEIIARDFEVLKVIRKSVECQLELIANHCCLYFCPMDLHHRNAVSHASQNGHECGGFVADHCKIACQREKLSRPAELIKARWIRPEDVDVYDDLGIDCLKLVERFRSTESLVEILDAYERRRWDGNLAELLTLPKEGAYMEPNLDLLERPDLVVPERLLEILSVLREPFTSRLYIDNTKLDRFIDHFRETDCIHLDCDRCGYCGDIASRVVTFDEGWRKDLIAKFDMAEAALLNGETAEFTVD